MRRKLFTIAALAAVTITGVLSGTASARPGDIPGDVFAAACVIPPDRDLNVTRTVYRVGRNLGVSDKVMLAGFEAGWVETHMNNLPCGDRDSKGVFQQRPSQGWGTEAQVQNVEYASNAFFTTAITVERDFPGLSTGLLADRVQRSCCPLKYDQAESKARAMLAEVEVTTSRVGNNDVTGDGYADLLVTKSTGELVNYANSINADPNRPYGPSVQIGTGFQEFTTVRSADLTGDGYAELVAVKPSGELLYFENNMNSNPGRVPYTTGRAAGNGFNAFSDFVLADVSGDGYADLLGIKANGEILYYPNNINSNSDRIPFVTGGERVGTGFQEFAKVRAADLTGDGYAELVAVKPTGELFYWENNKNSNPGGVPYTAAKDAGNGFNAFSDFVLSDVSGDGYADLTAWTAGGTVHYYANNINSIPGRKPFGSGKDVGEGFQTYDRLV